MTDEELDRFKIDLRAAQDIGVLDLTPLDDYRERRPVWVDKPMLQSSAFHLLVGRKGVCKGTYLAGKAAAMTNGKLLKSGEPKRVLILTSEDSIEMDFLPRFRIAGGVTSLVSIIGNKFKLPGSIGALGRRAKDLGDVGMIVLDPLGNHTGGKDTNAEGATRDAISGLNDLADELECMIFGVRHLGKNAQNGPLAAVLGSTAWVDTPRAVLAMAADDEDPLTFHLQLIAGNRAAKSEGARLLRLEVLQPDPDDPEYELTRIIEAGPSTKDVGDLLTGETASKNVTGKAKARAAIFAHFDGTGNAWIASDELDVIVAQASGLKARTARDVRMTMGSNGEGLIRARQVLNTDTGRNQWECSLADVSPALRNITPSLNGNGQSREQSRDDAENEQSREWEDF